MVGDDDGPALLLRSAEALEASRALFLVGLLRMVPRKSRMADMMGGGDG
jgi:hypothetical protein